MKIHSRRDEMANSLYYFFQHEDEVVAEVELEYFTNGEACLCNVYTRQQSRRKGFCARLVQHVVDNHPDETLFLNVDGNCELGEDFMRKFYVKFGFESEEAYPDTLWRNKKE